MSEPDNTPEGYVGQHYRTGRHNVRNIYRVDAHDGAHIAVVLREDDAAWVAAALDVYATAVNSTQKNVTRTEPEDPA